MRAGVTLWVGGREAGWGWGQDPGAGRLHSLPSPTADQGNPGASLFSVFGDLLSACCLHSGHNRSRQSAKPAPGQRAQAECPEGAVGGGTGTGTWVGSLTGVRGMKSAGWEPAPGPEGGLSCSALRAAEWHKPRWGSGGLQRP